MTTKEKIDQALGISCGKSMDQMLDELDIDSDGIEKTLNGFDDTLRKEVDNIDRKALELQKGVGNGALAISDMTDSLKEIEGLVNEAKAIFLHIKENIVSSDLIDSELIQGAAKFLEAVHVNIAEFISIYKQKSKFVEKIKLMIFQQQQRLELEEKRFQHNLAIIEAKKKDASPEEVAEGEFEFDTDTIIKSMQTSGAFDIQKPTEIMFDGEENPCKDDDDDDDEEEHEDDAPKKKKR